MGNLTNSTSRYKGQHGALRAARANTIYRLLIEEKYLCLNAETYRRLGLRYCFKRREVQQAIDDLVNEGRAEIGDDDGWSIEVLPIGEEASCPAS